jgi:hypothetical protein
MSDENIFEELAETRRKLWGQSDGTIAGYAALCEKIALQARAEYAQYGDAWRGVGRDPDWEKLRKGTVRPDPDGTEPAWTQPVRAGTMMVCEGDAPKYGAGARKGAEGEG